MVIDHPELLALHDYWQARRGERALPAPDDMVAADLWRWLPHIAVIDVEDEPRRFRYASVGNELVRILGEELSGTYLDQRPLLYRRYATPAYDELMRQRAPTFAKVEGFIPVFRVRYRRLMLPLSHDGETVTRIVAAFYPF